MICPSCGVDSDLYLEQKAEEERKAKREKEFEQTYSKQLRPIRRKRALIGGVVITLLFVCGVMFFALFCDLIITGSFEPIQFFGGLLVAFLGDPFFAVLFSCLCLFSLLFSHIYWLPRVVYFSKQEKELRKNFGL